MIASLMMYARPELVDANARLWASIRAALAKRDIDAPSTLSQSAPPFEVWEDAALVLSQTCGMPYRTRLKDRVKLVGTPDYQLEGCPAGHYRSAIMVRADDPRETLGAYADARLAYNAPHSQSGFAALYNHAAPSGIWFQTRIESGAHLASARMVAQGQADIAALDGQTWRLIQRYEGWAAKLRVLEYTAPTPGLPLITGTAQDANVVFEAVAEAFDTLLPQAAAALDLHGLIRIPQADYLAVPNPADSALT
jgi:ABC-type phosphate/phosphonate transport system substrate-binding protein